MEIGRKRTYIEARKQNDDSLEKFVGKQKKGKRGSIKILQTMVNDLRMEMKVKWWKSQGLFQPLVAAGGDERKKFKRDCLGDGPAGPSNIRMFGAPKVCGEGTFTEVAVAQLL